MAAKKRQAAKKRPESTEQATCIRAVRVEIIKPLSEDWETAGETMRALAWATPILGNAALNALTAIDIVKVPPVKEVIAPNAQGESDASVAYQAVLRKADDLIRWGVKAKNQRAANLSVSSSFCNEISRTAKTIHRQARKERTRAAFKQEYIPVRATDLAIARDERGPTVSVKLRPVGAVTFAIARSTGRHAEIVHGLIDGTIPYGSCKIHWNDRRKKWFVNISYHTPIQTPAPDVKVENVLIVHRGVRNVVTFLDNVRGVYKEVRGNSYLTQRARIRARQRSLKSVRSEERGSGAKGHGVARRYEPGQSLGDKLARITTTFCQQIAAMVVKRATEFGCGTVIIEDYGGIQASEDRGERIALDRFPFYQLKQSIASACERAGLAMKEVSAGNVTTTCPRCREENPNGVNPRSGIYHCRWCDFTRAGDYVSTFWMLERSKADASVIVERMRDEKKLRDEWKKEEAAE